MREVIKATCALSDLFTFASQFSNLPGTFFPPQNYLRTSQRGNFRLLDDVRPSDSMVQASLFGTFSISFYCFWRLKMLSFSRKLSFLRLILEVLRHTRWINWVIVVVYGKLSPRSLLLLRRDLDISRSSASLRDGQIQFRKESEKSDERKLNEILIQKFSLISIKCR